jgi:enamine deaminase RidA (YjgF/YER057c/UK114 family)
VKTTTYFTDIKSVGVLRDIRKRYLDPTHPPANAMIPLPVLSRADLLIEIEAIAILRTSFHP